MKNRSSKLKYKKLSEQFDLPVEVIEKICDSQFEFCKSIISEGNDEQIRLQGLGTFEVKPNARENVKKRIERIKKAREKKNGK